MACNGTHDALAKSSSLAARRPGACQGWRTGRPCRTLYHRKGARRIGQEASSLAFRAKQGGCDLGQGTLDADYPRPCGGRIKTEKPIIPGSRNNTLSFVKSICTAS